MPIKIATESHLVQVCASCGAEHTITFDRGGQKSRTGPFTLRSGMTLAVKVDAAEPMSVTFAAGDFPDLGAVTATQLAAKLGGTIPGITARDDAGGVLMESETTGEGSRVDIVDGTAREALGFPANGTVDTCAGRPVLGISLGPGRPRDGNVIALRRCNDCGATECLVRTHDSAGQDHDGTHFKEHRRTVNALAEFCRARGWSHPDLAAAHSGETTRPVDIDASFPLRPSVPMARIAKD